ncbi:hypothetical protein BKA62DRAFT_98800 [Auriculariales sp. MPI-PUGE-AT-0066]|nr:hypothetical protein BKA62DRAFT_98800 [Auriculariales sp. MPI-PUGE-AT-0066]
MAAVILLVTTAALAFYVATTFAPLLFPECPTRTFLLRQTALLWRSLFASSVETALPGSTKAIEDRLVRTVHPTQLKEHVFVTMVTEFPASHEVRAAIDAIGSLERQDHPASQFNMHPRFKSPSVVTALNTFLQALGAGDTIYDSHSAIRLLRARKFLSTLGSVGIDFPSDWGTGSPLDIKRIILAFDTSCTNGDYPISFLPLISSLHSAHPAMPGRLTAISLLLDVDEVLHDNSVPPPYQLLIRAHILRSQVFCASELKTLSPAVIRLVQSLREDLQIGSGHRSPICDRPLTLESLDLRLQILHVSSHLVEVFSQARREHYLPPSWDSRFESLAAMLRESVAVVCGALVHAGPEDYRFSSADECAHVFRSLTDERTGDGELLGWSYELFLSISSHWKRHISAHSQVTAELRNLTSALFNQLHIHHTQRGGQEALAKELLNSPLFASDASADSRLGCVTLHLSSHELQKCFLLERNDSSFGSPWRILCGVLQQESDKADLHSLGLRLSTILMAVRRSDSHNELNHARNRMLAELLGEDPDGAWYGVDLIREWKSGPARRFCSHIKQMAPLLWQKFYQQVLAVPRTSWSMLSMENRPLSAAHFVLLVNSVSCGCPTAEGKALSFFLADPDERDDDWDTQSNESGILDP